jgi:uncharacterized membrane protein
MFPVPLAAQRAPAEARQVHVAPVSEAGNESVTVAPVTNDGPTLVTTIVYVFAVPGTADAFPSVFVTVRSPDGFNVSVSVAELFPVASTVPVGAVTVAVFTTLPVAVAATVAFNVYVAVPLGNKLTVVSLMLPVPDAAQAEPAVATQVHVALINEAGNESATVAPVTADGPALVATIVYVTAVPGIFEATPSVLVMLRSAVMFAPSVSVAELLPGTGSMPPGTVAVTVFTSEPVCDGETVAVTV